MQPVVDHSGHELSLRRHDRLLLDHRRDHEHVVVGQVLRLRVGEVDVRPVLTERASSWSRTSWRVVVDVQEVVGRGEQEPLEIPLRTGAEARDRAHAGSRADTRPTFSLTGLWLLRRAIAATSCTRTAICARVKPSGKTIRNGFGGDRSRRLRCDVRVVHVREGDDDRDDDGDDRADARRQRDEAPTADLLARRPARAAAPCSSSGALPLEVARQEMCGRACIVPAREHGREPLVVGLDRASTAHRAGVRRTPPSRAPAHRARPAASAACRRRPRSGSSAAITARSLRKPGFGRRTLDVVTGRATMPVGSDTATPVRAEP